MGRRGVALALGLVLATLAPTLAAAQEDEASEPTPGAGQIVALRLRQPAPFAGLLIEQDDLVRWRLEIERLRFELDAERRRAAAELEVHRGLFERHLALSNDRLTLVQSLWEERATELQQSLQQALERAERDLWEQPGFSVAIGLAIGLVLGVAGMAVALVAAGGGV